MKVQDQPLGSVVSYPRRGDYGDSRYRGNCSGYLIADLVRHFQPQRVIDPMQGSGTTVEVCREYGIECDAYDLNPKPRYGVGGWDAATDEVERGADFIFVHPPYWNIVKYSGSQWGHEPDPRDLSQVATWDAFVHAMNHQVLKWMSTVDVGGRCVFLVGDISRKDKIYSMPRDIDWIGTPERVLIKTQHNTVSERRNYSGRFIPVLHEYVIILRRDHSYRMVVRRTVRHEMDLRDVAGLTWRGVVYAALDALGGRCDLPSLYGEIDGHAKCANNTAWQAKIRQTLQIYDDFGRVERGRWALVA